MVKKVFIFIIVILLILGGTLLMFPWSAKVEKVYLYILNNDTERLNYWLKEGKWNFNPQKKYLVFSYVISVQPHLPIRGIYYLGGITYKRLNDDFKVVILEPAMGPHGGAGCFEKKLLYFDLFIEAPKDMDPKTVINNIELKLRPYKWTNFVKVLVPENVNIELQ